MTSSLGRDIISVIKLQILVTAVGLITQIFLARYLGSEQKGVLDLFLLIPAVLASVIDVGLLSANTYLAGKRRVPTDILHSHSVLWSLLASIILLLVALVFRPSLQILFGNFNIAFLILSVTLAGPTLYFSLWSSLMYGIDKVQSVYRFNATTSILALVLYAIVAYTFGLKISAFLYATTAIIMVKAIAALVMLGYEVPIKLSVDIAALKISLSYGVAVYLGLIINTLHLRLDQFFVSSLKGPADLANYALAVRIAEIVWLLDYAIINASIFRITASTVEEATRITQRMARLVGSLIALACIIMAIAAPFVIPLVFGTDFAPAAIPLMLLLPGTIAWSLSRILAQFVAYQSGKPWQNMLVASSGFLLNLLLIVVLIPVWGIRGAAISSSFSHILNLALTVWIFRRLSKAEILPTFIPQKQDFVVLKEIVAQYVRGQGGSQG
jgi:O-antigen/teichoic acid export membrane protein